MSPKNTRNAKFGANMRHLRKSLSLLKGKNLSQRELGDLFDLSRETVIRWESGIVPHQSNLENIAKFFSERFAATITPDDLLNRDMRDILRVQPVPKELQHLTRKQRDLLSKLHFKASSLSPEMIEHILALVENMLPDDATD